MENKRAKELDIEELKAQLTPCVESLFNQMGYFACDPKWKELDYTINELAYMLKNYTPDFLMQRTQRVIDMGVAGYYKQQESTSKFCVAKFKSWFRAAYNQLTSQKALVKNQDFKDSEKRLDNFLWISHADKYGAAVVWRFNKAFKSREKELYPVLFERDKKGEFVVSMHEIADAMEEGIDPITLFSY